MSAKCLRLLTGSCLRNHNLEKILNNLHNLPSLSKNSPISTQSRNWKEFLFFSQRYLSICFLVLSSTSTYVLFLPGVVWPSYVPTIFLYWGEGKPYVCNTNEGSCQMLTFAYGGGGGGGKGLYLRNHNLEKMLNNFHNIPNLNKNSLLFLPKAESERVLFFSGTFFTWCSLAIICTYYFLYGGGGPRGHAYISIRGCQENLT